MATNRRKLIEDVKRALATLQPGDTDKDFRRLLDFVMQKHQSTGTVESTLQKIRKGKPRNIDSAQMPQPPATN